MIQKLHDALYTLETVDTSRRNSWGLMTLLMMKSNLNLDTFTWKHKKSIEKNIKDSSEDYSPEISDKYEDSEVDTNQSKKEETV
jgi:hypothetical protein